MANTRRRRQWRTQYVEHGPAPTEALIAGAKHNALHGAQAQHGRAHDARLQRHIERACGHGQPGGRQHDKLTLHPSTLFSCANATVSAWRVASRVAFPPFRPRATMTPWPLTTTHPTGTSPSASAALASTNAASMNSSTPSAGASIGAGRTHSTTQCFRAQNVRPSPASRDARLDLVLLSSRVTCHERQSRAAA